jgi:outer membrane protein assembly factor BamB
MGFGGNLYAIAADGGGEWVFQGDGQLTAPVIGADGTIYAGSDTGTLHAINADDGFCKWFDINSGCGWKGGAGAITATPAVGPDGTIYVGSEDGNVYAIRDVSVGAAAVKAPVNRPAVWPMAGHDRKHTSLVPSGSIFESSFE